ncbi:unnamed protein product [Meloidogyne enterolobii]|uniref:Uncharacterized protein n=1 Tax=Meloidogyne enterolobii TaxID=390850 RepID=A0ACB1B1G5_MELEN
MKFTSFFILFICAIIVLSAYAEINEKLAVEEMGENAQFEKMAVERTSRAKRCCCGGCCCGFGYGFGPGFYFGKK